MVPDSSVILSAAKDLACTPLRESRPQKKAARRGTGMPARPVRLSPRVTYRLMQTDFVSR